MTLRGIKIHTAKHHWVLVVAVLAASRAGDLAAGAGGNAGLGAGGDAGVIADCALQGRVRIVRTCAVPPGGHTLSVRWTDLVNRMGTGRVDPGGTLTRVEG